MMFDVRKVLRHFGSYLAGGHQFSYLQSQDPWIDPIDKEFFLSREETYYLPKDQNGVPVLRYESGGSYRYLPSRVTSYGLANWNRYRRFGDAGHREAFLRCAEWFMQFEDGRFRHQFDLPGLKAPWISGLAQGEGISLLTRAYVLTGEDRFVDQARRAFLPMTKTIRKGGVRSALRDGSYFIEEYPLSQPGHVLNGFLRALFGISDLHRVCPTAQTQEILDACWNSLAKNIECWDLNGWSAYDLHNFQGSGPRNYCTVTYHSQHVVLLKYAYELTGRDIFREFAQRWDAGLNSILTRLRGMAGKAGYRSQYPKRYRSQRQ